MIRKFKNNLVNLIKGFAIHPSPITHHPSSILIACSGGIDSMALLHLMSELKSELGFKLGACYVDHKLRSESGIEAEFVDKICHILGVHFYLVEFTEEFWKDGRENFEERARNERYRLLVDCANCNGFQYLATAHHLDDQVETVLMRLFDRGTGLKGLCGIKPCKGEKSFAPTEEGVINLAPTIIRPLLNFTRTEIEGFMEGRDFVTDHSNKNTDIRRNFYRHNVIPAIQNELKSEEFKHHISKLSENAVKETEFTRTLVSEFFDNFCKNDDTFEITRETIEKYSDNFWLTAFSYFFADHRKFSHSTKTLKDIVAFIRKTDPGTASYSPYIFKRDSRGVRICS